MGCDIHLHGEVKIAGVWRHWSQPNITRNYDLFTKMAGVRSEGREDIVPISAPRGLPEDITFETRFDCERWTGDGHSHSWLSSEELGLLTEWADKHFAEEGHWYSFEMEEIGYLMGNGWDVKKYPEENYGVEDSRFVFWFDN